MRGASAESAGDGEACEGGHFRLRSSDKAYRRILSLFGGADGRGGVVRRWRAIVRPVALLPEAAGEALGVQSVQLLQLLVLLLKATAASLHSREVLGGQREGSY